MKTHVKPGQLCSLTEIVCEMQWRQEYFLEWPFQLQVFMRLLSLADQEVHFAQ